VVKLRVKGVKYYFRTVEPLLRFLKDAGFKVELVEPTARGREETWFIASVGAPGAR
jgi:hypothetical protein